jgi:site-specific DNA-methyltransferase (adenine-specific)
LAFVEKERTMSTVADTPGVAERPVGQQAAALYRIFQADAFAWLEAAAVDSIHAVVTDPPYGLIEFSAEQLEKRRRGKGGVWRIPPSFDGSQPSPLPRFTVLEEAEREQLRAFFRRLAERLVRVLVPGAHVFVATNPFEMATRAIPLLAGIP